MHTTTFDENPIFKTIWSFVLKKLSVRPHSKKELIEKTQRSFPDQANLIAFAIVELERLQLLDDQRFAEQYLQHLIQKPMGRLKIHYHAKQKGFSLKMVDAILENFQWSEKEAAIHAAQEKSRFLKLDGSKQKIKLMQFLKGRGFSASVIYQVCHNENE